MRKGRAQRVSAALLARVTGKDDFDVCAGGGHLAESEAGVGLPLCEGLSERPPHCLRPGLVLVGCVAEERIGQVQLSPVALVPGAALHIGRQEPVLAQANEQHNKIEQFHCAFVACWLLQGLCWDLASEALILKCLFFYS